jgi:hypothetical protein
MSSSKAAAPANANGKKRKKSSSATEILAEVPQPSQWTSSNRSSKHKQKLSKFRYVTKADKRKVANGPQYAAKIFVFNEGVQIGHYESEEDAARQADMAVLFYRHKYPNSGKFWLNFPLSSYPAAVRNGQVLPSTPLVKNVYADSFVKAGALRRVKAESDKGAPSSSSTTTSGASGASGAGASSGKLKGGARHVGKTGVVRGIGKYKGKFGAYISFKNKRVDLGYYETAEEAARTYDMASLRYRGPHAPLNYPRSRYNYNQVYAKALPGNWNDGRSVGNAQTQMFALVDAELEAVERRHHWELMDWKIRADKYEKELNAAQKKIAALQATATGSSSSSSSATKKSSIETAVVPAAHKQRAPVTSTAAADVGRAWFFSTNYKKEMAGVTSKKRRRIDPQYQAEIERHRQAAGYAAADKDKKSPSSKAVPASHAV